MLQAGRSRQSGGYRFGYQGQEADNKIGGLGQHTTAQFWEYDTWAVRRWNVDPITYPWQGSYTVFNNDPIRYADPLGLYGSEKKAERRRKQAEKRGWETGKVYQSGNEWGFNKFDSRGENGSSVFKGKNFDAAPDWQGEISSSVEKWSDSDNFFAKFVYSWADAPVVLSTSLLMSPRHLNGQWATPSERQRALVDVAANVVLGEIGGAKTLGASKSLGIVDDVVGGGSNLWKVGSYSELRGLEVGLDAHHVGQKAIMKKFVPGYNENTAPSILVPKLGHTNGVGVVSRSTTGFTNARQVLARDIFELRRVYGSQGIPNSSLQQLIQMNKTMYSGVFIK